MNFFEHGPNSLLGNTDVHVSKDMHTKQQLMNYLGVELVEDGEAF